MWRGRRRLVQSLLLQLCCVRCLPAAVEDVSAAESTAGKLGGWPATGPCTKFTAPNSQLNFHAQSGQDAWVLRHLVLGCDEGVFVEFGARNGIQHSNTLAFEQHLGWRGLLFEADASEASELRANRPRSVVYEGAVCPPGQSNITFRRSSMGGWSGPQASYEPSRHERPAQLTTVACYDLAAELRRHRMHRVDYMTIDTEGSELELVVAFPWHEFDVRVVQIEQLDEAQYPAQRGKKAKIISHMVTQGFRLRTAYQIHDPGAPGVVDTEDLIFVIDADASRAQRLSGAASDSRSGNATSRRRRAGPRHAAGVEARELRRRRLLLKK